jgi:CHASE3 domain sensor protein
MAVVVSKLERSCTSLLPKKGGIPRCGPPPSGRGLGGGPGKNIKIHPLSPFSFLLSPFPCLLLKPMKITTKLHLIFFVIMMLIGIVGSFAMFQIYTLFILSTHVKNHVSVVESNAAHEISINFLKIVNRMKEVTSFSTQTDLDSTIQTIASYEENIVQSFHIIENKWIGDKSDFDKVTRLFEDWKSIRNEIIALYKSGKRIEANLLIVEGRGAEQINKLETALKELQQFMDANVEKDLERTNTATKTVFQISIAMVILIFLVEWLTFIISRFIIHDMALVLGMLNKSNVNTPAKTQTEASQPSIDPQTKISQKIIEVIQTALNDSLQKLDRMEVQLQELQEKNQKLQAENQKLQEDKPSIETLPTDSALENETETSPKISLDKSEEFSPSVPAPHKGDEKGDLLVPSANDKNQTVTEFSKAEKSQLEEETHSIETSVPINQNQTKVLEPVQSEKPLTEEEKIAERILSTLKASETDTFTDLFAEDDIYHDFQNPNLKAQS